MARTRLPIMNDWTMENPGEFNTCMREFAELLSKRGKILDDGWCQQISHEVLKQLAICNGYGPFQLEVQRLKEKCERLESDLRVIAKMAISQHADEVIAASQAREIRVQEAWRTRESAHRDMRRCLDCGLYVDQCNCAHTAAVTPKKPKEMINGQDPSEHPIDLVTEDPVGVRIYLCRCGVFGSFTELTDENHEVIRKRHAEALRKLQSK